MDFFRNQWVPARSVHQPEFQYKTPERRSPKVVQIPVHFVRSETTRSGSALKIQKVFRGYLVRKSLKKIVAIKREVDAIEARVSDKEVADLIRKNEKERLKVNESLMSLLLKLDAVSGGAVDSGVRVCRKAVIRKAIALQEKVDSLSNSQILGTTDDAAIVVENGDDRKQEMIEGNSEESQSTSISGNYMEGEHGKCSSDGEFESVMQNMADQASVVKRDELNRCVDCVMEEVDANEDPSVAEPVAEEMAEQASVVKRDEQSSCVDVAMEEEDASGEPTVVQCVVGDIPELETDGINDDNDNKRKYEVNDEENCVQSQALSDFAMEKLEHDDEADNGTEVEEGVDDDVSEMGVDEKAKEKNGGVDDGDKKNNEVNQLMEKMMQENGKVMKMMSDLLERNEAQARMLNTLTLRLEQLEKAFVCDKIRRKKKRHCS